MSETVKVTFVDASSGELLFTANMPPENLPESFEADTTMHLGDEDWKVIKAEPVLASEFIQTGSLTLTLQKINVQFVDPKKILYSLPTLSNDIGEILEGSTKVGKDVLSFHYDDWRQLEFVSRQYQAEIESEFQKILQIYNEESVISSNFRMFKKLHLRSQIVRPIAGQVSLEKFFSSFPVQPYRYDGLSYDGVAGLVENGFAFMVDESLNFYGQALNDNIEVLGISLDDADKSPSPETIQGLAAFMNANDLTLVDWLSLEQMNDSASLIQYLNLTQY